MKRHGKQPKSAKLRDGAWDPAVAAGSDGLSLCDDSCEAVSGEASVKRVLGLGGVFRGGRTVE